MRPLRHADLWWATGLVLALLVAVFSLLPPGEGPPTVSDKLLHFLTYAFLGGWFASLSPRTFMVCFLVVGWGGVIELLQGLTPLRQPEWLDLLANTVGAFVGVLIARLLPRSPFALVESLLPEARHEP